MRLFLLAFVLLAAACASPRASALTPQTPVQNCLVGAGQNAEARRACIGSFSRTCIERDEGNQTNGGMVRCIDAERQQWLTALGEHVAILRERESPTQIALLDAALAEHERWAQARCAYATSIYEGGSLARVVGAHCMRDTAAEFTIELIARSDEF